MTQTATTQTQPDNLAAYNLGRRDEQKALESVIESMLIDQTIDTSTAQIVMGYIATLDRRPKVKL